MKLKYTMFFQINESTSRRFSIDFNPSGAATVSTPVTSTCSDEEYGKVMFL